jgi:hypothetical protein
MPIANFRAEGITMTHSALLSRNYDATTAWLKHAQILEEVAGRSSRLITLATRAVTCGKLQTGGSTGRGFDEDKKQKRVAATQTGGSGRHAQALDLGLAVETMRVPAASCAECNRKYIGQEHGFFPGHIRVIVFAAIRLFRQKATRSKLTS